MQIFCVKDSKKIEAKQITGKEIYPHRIDLYSLKFYQCPICNNYVGTHKNSGLPLGSIPTPELKKARMAIHRLIDPLWKTKKISRGKLYAIISEKLGKPYHSAELNNFEDVNKVLMIAKELCNKIS